jgi:predicted nucleotidyltransferase
MSPTLFKTITGSHVWEMETPKSDIDEAQVFITSTKSILSGMGIPKTKKFTTRTTDVTQIEIGPLIESLIKNNINAIIMVASPCSTYELKHYRKELIQILKNNISKNCFNSINGLGNRNYKKYIQTEKDASQKRINTICRSLQFGITLLDTGKIKFRSFYDGTPEDIKNLLKEIHTSFTESPLPEKSDEVPFREFLFKLRKKELDSALF